VHRPPSKDGPLPEEDPVSHSDASQTPEEILEYWTPERMAEAKPREIRLPDPQGEPEPSPEDN
jgi:hypothetical protein